MVFLNIIYLFNMVSQPLTLLQTLACIAAEINYITYIHIFMHYTENKIVICQLQNALSNFLKFCKVCARQKSKNESSIFIYKFGRNFCFSSKFKNCFQVLFIAKVNVTKKIHYMHLTLYSHILTSLLLLVAGSLKVCITFFTTGD